METPQETIGSKLEQYGYSKEEIGEMSDKKASETLTFVKSMLEVGEESREESNPYVKEDQAKYLDYLDSEVSKGRISLPKGGLITQEMAVEAGRHEFYEREYGKDTEMEM